MKVIYSIVIASLLMFGSAVYAEELMANLPPDPGAAGKATLAGIDSDSDGVRDDVQRWIVMTYPNSEKTRAALRQAALTMQQFILSANNPIEAYNIATKMGKDYECFAYISLDSYNTNSELKANMLNTYLRSKTWLQADKHLSGKTFKGTDYLMWKQNCGFDPDAMPN